MSPPALTAHPSPESPSELILSDLEAFWRGCGLEPRGICQQMPEYTSYLKKHAGPVDDVNLLKMGYRTFTGYHFKDDLVAVVEVEEARVKDYVRWVHLSMLEWRAQDLSVLGPRPSHLIVRGFFFNHYR